MIEITVPISKGAGFRLNEYVFSEVSRQVAAFIEQTPKKRTERWLLHLDSISTYADKVVVRYQSEALNMREWEEWHERTYHLNGTVNTEWHKGGKREPMQKTA